MGPRLGDGASASALLSPASETLSTLSGASGMLHAASFILAHRLLRADERRQRGLGAVLALVLTFQLLGPLLPGRGSLETAWGFKVAHGAHRAGVLAAALALIVMGAVRRTGSLWRQ